jgi:transposase
VRPHPALGHLEEALALLETGMSDLEIARKRQLSARTIEDHKRRILDLGIRRSDLVNDPTGHRPARTSPDFGSNNSP